MTQRMNSVSLLRIVYHTPFTARKQAMIMCIQMILRCLHFQKHEILYFNCFLLVIFNNSSFYIFKYFSFKHVKVRHILLKNVNITPKLSRFKTLTSRKFFHTQRFLPMGVHIVLMNLYLNI